MHIASDVQYESVDNCLRITQWRSRKGDRDPLQFGFFLYNEEDVSHNALFVFINNVMESAPQCADK
jgi:hypothetical protein